MISRQTDVYAQQNSKYELVLNQELCLLAWKQSILWNSVLVFKMKHQWGFWVNPFLGPTAGPRIMFGSKQNHLKRLDLEKQYCEPVPVSARSESPSCEPGPRLVHLKHLISLATAFRQLQYIYPLAAGIVSAPGSSFRWVAANLFSLSNKQLMSKDTAFLLFADWAVDVKQ